MDYISREMACDYIAEFINNPYSTQDECEMVEAMIDGMQHIPPATPKPKTGQWVNKSRRSGCGVLFVESECTCCGKKTPFNCDEFLYRYCPNCGARMEVEE